MSYIKTIDVNNLNARKYIHGTSIVKSVIDHLNDILIRSTDFSIRLHRTLYSLPRLTLVDGILTKEDLAPDVVVSGSIRSRERLYSFILTPSGEPCTKVNVIDEQSLEEKIEINNGRYVINKLTINDDFLVALSAIERTKNFELFKDDPDHSLSQMWFTGMTLSNFDFLKQPLKSVSSTVAYDKLSKNCVRRVIFYNEKPIGTRIAVYAKRLT